jgi:hypothetical protein
MNNPLSLGDELRLASKLFCDNVSGGFTNESFLLAMYSGKTPTVFVLTPSHMKRLFQWMKHQIDDYEKQNGEIKAEWNPNIPSPLQASDL